MYLKKIIYFVKEEGFWEFAYFLLQKLRKIVFNRVTTIYVRFSSYNLDKRYEFDGKVVTYDKAVRYPVNFRNGRMDQKKLEEYLTQGGKCYLFFSPLDELVGYGILRKERFYIEDGVSISIENDSYWLGPIYIYKKFRERGYGKIIISNVLHKHLSQEKTSCFYTCINSMNIASIKAFLNCGFYIFGYMITTHHFRKKKNVFISQMKEKLDIDFK